MMEPKEKKAFEPSGLVPRSIVRTFERFRQQLLPGSETAAIREYRISRYQVLVSARCLFTLLTIPIATNWLVSSWLLSPLIEHFWNTQQNEIFLNSYQEERAFAELEFFSEKLFFESLLNNARFTESPTTSYSLPGKGTDNLFNNIIASNFTTRKGYYNPSYLALKTPRFDNFGVIVSMHCNSLPPLGVQRAKQSFANTSLSIGQDKSPLLLSVGKKIKESTALTCIEDVTKELEVEKSDTVPFYEKSINFLLTPLGVRKTELHSYDNSLRFLKAPFSYFELNYQKPLKETNLYIDSKKNTGEAPTINPIQLFFKGPSINKPIHFQRDSESKSIDSLELSCIQKPSLRFSALQTLGGNMIHLTPKGGTRKDVKEAEKLIDYVNNKSNENKEFSYIPALQAPYGMWKSETDPQRGYLRGKKFIETKALSVIPSIKKTKESQKLIIKINREKNPLIEDAKFHASFTSQLYEVSKPLSFATEGRGYMSPLSWASYPEGVNGKGYLIEEDINSLKIKEQVQDKILQLAVYYNQQTILSITNIIGDLVSLFTLGCLFIWMKPEITILKSFLIEAIYSLSDTTKSFLLILLTDLLVGFHSPRGWETALELLLKHFGLPENQDFVFLFVATFPVLLDTVFKYWIFRHLNKISPSTVATYHSMIE